MRLKSTKAIHIKTKSTKSVLPEIIKSLYNNGTITETDLTSKRLVFAKIRKFIESGSEEAKSEEPGETILKLAEEQALKGYADLGISLFISAIDHSLDRIIHSACRQRGIDFKTETEILKGVNTLGKCTWLIKVLRLPHLNNRHLKTLIDVLEQRSDYLDVRKDKAADTSNTGSNKIQSRVSSENLSKIKSLLKHLRAYEVKQQSGA